jgi:hypothetical protein
VSRVFIYKTFIIQSTPLQLDAMQWRPSIAIDWERDGEMMVRTFSADRTSQTEAEADLYGIAYGQRIIDGQVPGCSVG